jgi:hypothetical protein
VLRDAPAGPLRPRSYGPCGRPRRRHQAAVPPRRPHWRTAAPAPGAACTARHSLACGLLRSWRRSQFGGPLDHQASAWVGCLPFGVARPPEPPAALRLVQWRRAATQACAQRRRSMPGRPQDLGQAIPGYAAGKYDGSAHGPAPCPGWCGAGPRPGAPAEPVRVPRPYRRAAAASSARCASSARYGAASWCPRRRPRCGGGELVGASAVTCLPSRTGQGPSAPRRHGPAARRCALNRG